MEDALGVKPNGTPARVTTSASDCCRRLVGSRDCGRPAVAVFLMRGNASSRFPRCEAHVEEMRKALTEFVQPEYWSETTISAR